MRRFLLTLGFMTRIPIKAQLEVKKDDMEKGFLYFPIIGLIIGGIAAGIYYIVSLILPRPIAIMAAILANLWVTGAFHLDGLADTADGIYSARTKERILEIMKDSRIGTNGGIAMIFDLALKFMGIYYSDCTWLVILLMPIAGKMVQGVLVYKATYPREKGIGIYVGTVPIGAVIGSMILGLIPMVLAFSIWGIVIWGVLMIFTYLFRRYITKIIGGITGDVMGAASELSEILFVLLLLIR